MTMIKVLIFAAIIGLLMITVPFITYYNAWWFSFIWQWFAIPLGAPAFTVSQLAMGLMVVTFPVGLSLTSIAVKVSEIKTESSPWIIFSYCFLYSPLAVGVAWMFKAIIL